MEEIMERKIADLDVKIHRDVCIGTQNCIRVASDVFELDEKQICTFRPNEAAIDREKLLEACRVCPVEALSAFDEDGSQLVP